MDNYKIIIETDYNNFQEKCNNLIKNNYLLYGELKVINYKDKEKYIQSFIKNTESNSTKIKINNYRLLKTSIIDNYHWSDWE